MRILIASDIHGSLESAQFLVQKAEEIKPQLCVLLGDFLYHGPRNPLPLQYTPQDVATTLGAIMDVGQGIDIVAVRGNCDALVDEELLPFSLSPTARLHIDGHNFIAAHGHQFGRDPDFTGIAAGTIMLTGHTHVPVAEKKDHVIWWNPGSLSLPKQGYPRSYGIYELGVYTIYDVQGNTFLQYTL